MQLFAEARRSNGTEAGSYVVKVFGGGHMFPEQITDEACRDASCSKARRESCVSIGCQNICAARHLLEAGGYAIAAEDVGGVGSRQIIFDLRSGDVWVKRGAAISAIAEVLA